MISQPELGGVCEVAHGVLVQLVAQAHREIWPQAPGRKLGRPCHGDEGARPKAPIDLASTHQAIANTCLEIIELCSNFGKTYLQLLPGSIVAYSSNAESYASSACAVLGCNMT